MPNIVNAETSFRELRNEGFESGFRAGVEQDQPVIRFDRGGSDDPAAAEVLAIEDVDHIRVLLEILEL
jgi:hypothetical protein